MQWLGLLQLIQIVAYCQEHYPVRPFGFIAPKTLNYLAFHPFDFERT